MPRWPFHVPPIGLKVVAACADAERVTTSQPGDSHRPRVVVIEDDVDVRLLLERHLGRLGWSVHGADSGEAGLELAAALHPDVVVVDLVLPGIGGADVVGALRADAGTAGCRVVVTSVLDRDEQLRLHPDAVLPKPFTRRDVGRAMAEVMA